MCVTAADIGTTRPVHTSCLHHLCCVSGPHQGAAPAMRHACAASSPCKPDISRSNFCPLPCFSSLLCHRVASRCCVSCAAGLGCQLPSRTLPDTHMSPVVSCLLRHRAASRCCVSCAACLRCHHPLRSLTSPAPTWSSSSWSLSDSPQRRWAVCERSQHKEPSTIRIAVVESLCVAYSCP